MPDQIIVQGRLLQPDETPVADARVQVFDKDLPSLERRGLGPQELGEATTAKDGSFEINYTAEQFQRGEAGKSKYRGVAKSGADLSFRISDARGQELVIIKIVANDIEIESGKILFNAPPETKVLIIIETGKGTAAQSEYEDILVQLAPVLEDVALADLMDDDLQFLTSETGIDRQRIDFLHKSAELARQTGLPTEAFYGFARLGLPLDLEKLIAQTSDALRVALVGAIDKNIVPAKLRERLDAIIRRLKRSNDVTQRVIMQLVDQETDLPLAGLIVQTFDLDVGVEPEELSYDKSDGTGRFTLIYGLPPTATPDTSRRLLLKIYDSDSKQIFETEVQVKPDQFLLQIRVTAPTAETPPSPGIQDLATTLHLDLPAELQQFLDGRNIHTLTDIRNAGVISQMAGLPLAPDHPTVQALEAHADLSRLSSDVSLNATLIEKGYGSVVKVAGANRTDFVGAVHKQLGDFKAAQMHVVARAQTAVLNNVMAGMRVEAANGHQSGFSQQIQSALAQPRCSCDDCEAAVSPLAYLTDLLDYSLKHLANNNQPISLQSLTDAFHQPFGNLRVSCDGAEQQVRQVRLCIEVLRSYLKVIHPTPLQLATLTTAEQSYRVDAYTGLLNQIGTSYDEIRLSRTNEPDSRQALATRLGISLTVPRPAGGDEMDRLFLDPSVQPPSPPQLTEAALEKLFGLVDTTRDPLVTNSSGPEFLSWRLNYLRTSWGLQDRPADAYSQGRLPVIDPDVIGRDDLRQAISGQVPFDVWQARRTEVDNSLANLKTSRESNGLTFMLKQVLGDPLPDLAQLQKDLTQSVDVQKTREAAKIVTETLRLSVESFTQLMALTDPAKTPTSAEWDEVYSILAQVQKVKQFLSWVTAEKSAAIVLGPKDFLISLNEPTLRRWLGSEEDRLAWQQTLRVRSQPPIIDPDLTSDDDLINPLVGSAAALLHARKDLIDNNLISLRANPKTLPSLDTMLKVWVGVEATELVALDSTRSAGNSIQARLDQLNLTNASFAYLLRIRSLLTASQPVLDSEWDDIYLILVQIWTIREFAAWRDEESAQGIVLASSDFKIPLPSPDTAQPYVLQALPPWRATWNARSDWQDTLQSRIDQENTTRDGVREAVSTTEEGALSKLRDALVMAVAAFGSTLSAKADWVTDRLFIDAKVRGCQQTTRVAQSIETLQAILFAARTGQFKSSWSPVKSVPGWFGTENQGADIAIADINGSGRPDLLVFHIDNPTGENHGYYRVGWNLDTSGDVASGWTDIKDPAFQIPGWFGTENQGAGIAIADLNGSGKHDLVVFHIDHAAGDNVGYYRIGWDLDSNGKVTGGWTDISDPAFQVKGGFGPENQGAGIAIADISGNGKPDLVIFHVNNPGGDNTGYYRIGWDLNSDGKVAGWSAVKALPNGLGWETAGAGIAVAGINGAGQRDLVVLYIDNAVGENSGYYRIGNGLDINGDVTGGWSEIRTVPGGFGSEDQGAGLAIADLSGNGRENLIVFNLENLVGENAGYYRICWDINGPRLSLNADSFDEEWNWIGTYATWRAAMFVFLYPENILLPSLRKWQTPAFAKLVTDLRAARLTPEDACNATKSYADYFNDVRSLTIDATCQASTLKSTGNSCQAGQSIKRNLFYMFGRAISGKAYWSAYDPEEPADYAQSFWDDVPGLEASTVIKIVGAMPYQSSPSMNLVASARAGAQAREPIRRYIYLFLLTLDDLKGPTKLKVVKYNLEGFGRSDAWETPIELTVPAKLDLTSVVPVQTTGESDPPGLAFQDGDGLIYVLSLNLQGDNWESAPDGSSPSVDAGQVSVLKGRFSARTLVAVVNINHRRWFCWVENGPGGFLWLFAYEYFTNYDQSSERSSFLVEIDVLGVMPWSSPNNLPTQIYIFDRQTSWWSDTGVFYHKATYDLSFHPSELLQGTKHPTASDLSRVIVNSGDAPPDQRRFAYERGGAQYYCSFMESGDSLNEYTTIPAVPRVAVPLNIPARLAEPELQMRRQRIREAFDANQDAPLSALTYLDEAYYFVPMFIALQLQRCGEYTAALDWFRTVYDYSAAPDQRKIYYGLEREASLAMVYQRASNWLLDPLDPHSIAASRPNTYTRFTLLMLVRCLLDYGDDEFSRDTPESLPRARTLYTTAMDLLNTDVLQQHLGTCQAVIGNLQIQ